MNLYTPGSDMAGQELQRLSASAREASDLFKALAHHTRLLILCILAEDEKTVGQLEETLGVQQAMVSQQLARLRMEGLVSSRREGRLVYYRVGRPCMVSFLRSLSAMFPMPEDA